VQAGDVAALYAAAGLMAEPPEEPS
jgi:hypothetical protein